MVDLVRSALEKALSDAMRMLTLEEEGDAAPPEILLNMVADIVRKDKRGGEITDADYTKVGAFLRELSAEALANAVYRALLSIIDAYGDDVSELALYINHLVRAVQNADIPPERKENSIASIRHTLLHRYKTANLPRLIIKLDADVEDALNLKPAEGEVEPITDVEGALSKLRDIFNTYEPPKDIAPGGWDVELVDKVRGVVDDIVEARVKGEMSSDEFVSFLDKLADIINDMKGEERADEGVIEKACRKDKEGLRAQCGDVTYSDGMMGAAQDVGEGKSARIRRLIRQLLQEIEELVGAPRITEMEIEEEPASDVSELTEEEERETTPKDQQRKCEIIAYSVVDALLSAVLAADGDDAAKDEVRAEIKDFARKVGVETSKVALMLANYLSKLLIKGILDSLGGA